MPGYIKVYNDEGDDVIEVPLSDNNTITNSTLSSNCPWAVGLKFILSTSPLTYRGLNFEKGNLSPPEGGWGNRLYFCIYSKVS